MKYLIAGLGNIGEEYAFTRHNIGFDVADRLIIQKDAGFSLDRLAFIADFKHRSRHFYVIKPTTYMNLSGKAIRYWLDKLNIPLTNLLVVVDDLALPLGTLRLKAKGSDAGHNGLKNIQYVLGTTNYPRLKVGIGNEFPKGQQVNFVLGEWSKEEWEEMNKRLDLATEMILSFGTIGIEQTMNQYNNK